MNVQGNLETVEVPVRGRDGPPFSSTQALEHTSQAQAAFGLDDEKNRQEPIPNTNMSHIKDQSLQSFLDDLASKSATPGGGSVAALLGAQAAALVAMVCQLTLGKPAYAGVEGDMLALLAKSEALRTQLTALIQADIDVFNRLMACYGLPKQSDAEKSARSEAIQSLLKEATQVPIECAKACKQVMGLSKIAADNGSVGVISDAGAAAMAAYGGLKTAALNVYINTGSLKDRAFAEAKNQELETLLAGAGELADEVYRLVKSRL